MTEPLLVAQDLSILLPSQQGPVRIVDDISFAVDREVVALVGESGSGKSMTARAVMGLLPNRAKVIARKLAFDGKSLTGLTPRGWTALRGSDIGLILQDPKYSLNPAHQVGRQVEEALLLHTRLSASERKQQALEMLRRVRLEDAERIYASYPAALSGGMGQRVMIAAMLVNRPKLLIADEPTSALDRSLQTQILGLLRALCREFGMGLLLISHDLQQVSQFADRVIVMRGGRIEEQMAAGDLSQASSDYTRALWAARPSAKTYGGILPVYGDER